MRQLPIAAEPNAAEPPLPRLDELHRAPHLAGCQALAVCWAICPRVLATDKVTAVSGLLRRAGVATELIVLLSGFTVHSVHTDCEALHWSVSSMVLVYLCHFIRALLSVQVGALLAALASWLSSGRGSAAAVGAKEAIGCSLLLRPWADATPDCPNGPSWLLAALVTSWLLYPLVIRKLLALTELAAAGGASATSFLATAFALWLVTALPSLSAAVWNRRWALKEGQLLWLWFWPPALFSDFALGAYVAAAARIVRVRARLAGFLADLALASVLLACWLLPSQHDAPVDDEAWRPMDPLAARLAAPALAAFLYWSVACPEGEPSRSVFARLLAHPALASAGPYAIEVYLFQDPLLRLVGGAEPEASLRSIPELFVYLLLLWVLAGVYVEFLALPLERWMQTTLRRCVDRHARQLFGWPFRVAEDAEAASEFRYL